MKKILCSTGALINKYREIENLKGLLDCLKCDGFEFLMYDTWYSKVDSIKSFFSKAKKNVPVFHVEKGVGDLLSRNEDGDTEIALTRFEVNCSLAKELGSKVLVLHLWGGIHSDKDMHHNLEYYKYLRDFSHSHGLLLTVENVICNNNTPLGNMQLLKKHYPDISFTFDTKMAEFHKELEHIYSDGMCDFFESSVKHLHINDYGGGYKDWNNLRTLHIGEGHVDFERFFSFINSINYQGDFTVEATSFDNNGNIDFSSLNRSFEKIRDYIFL